MGSSGFARRYCRNRIALSVPPVTEMFHFTGSRLAGPLVKRAPIAGRCAGGVTPFGHPRVNARWPLAVAYRSLPRPSSPLGTKASRMRPYVACDRFGFALLSKSVNQDRALSLRLLQGRRAFGALSSTEVVLLSTLTYLLASSYVQMSKNARAPARGGPL